MDGATLVSVLGFNSHVVCQGPIRAERGLEAKRNVPFAPTSFSDERKKKKQLVHCCVCEATSAQIVLLGSPLREKKKILVTLHSDSCVAVKRERDCQEHLAPD